MLELLRRAELFEGLNDDDIRQIAAIGRPRALHEGEYLFLLGDDASHFYVVLKGRVNLCFPMPLCGEVKDIALESVGQGQALGWSALVKPYRFTLTARATEPSEVVGFARQGLTKLFEAEPQIGLTFYMRISELVGIRLATFQALWARQLQRLAERPTNTAGVTLGEAFG